MRITKKLVKAQMSGLTLQNVCLGGVWEGPEKFNVSLVLSRCVLVCWLERCWDSPSGGPPGRPMAE